MYLKLVDREDEEAFELIKKVTQHMKSKGYSD